MAKARTVFVCQNCGAQSPKWIGHCPACGEWNTYNEEIIASGRPGGAQTRSSQKEAKPTPINQVVPHPEGRYALKDAEFNRVLGGGIVPGSAILLGGEPGIGKSTLLLQMALQESRFKTLYIAGEESETQIRMRAERIGITHEELFLLAETNVELIVRQMEALQPNVVIVDSIQTIFTEQLDSAPGSVSQIRESAALLIQYAKRTLTPIFLIGHINKEGTIAGPKVLEHMVDTVLQFEGDRHHVYRLLRCLKNRFGSAYELGIYEMQGAGLKEVSNPSEILLSPREAHLSGISVAAVLEGMRPMLIEVQALVSSAVYGTPQRSATGFDTRRLNMLLAVLEKRCGFRLGSKDVFLNVTGGIKIDDPAADLSVMASILSSTEDIPLDPHICFAAEVGLSGEVRPVNRVEARIREAAKLGFNKIIVSPYNKGLPKLSEIEILPISRIDGVVSELFG